ncbi:MAG: DUF2029 domain-containing protein [Chitinophagaceae bacterium]|nr:DUF2029 domain-containing protein [Chitinophagaceae bacterium]
MSRIYSYIILFLSALALAYCIYRDIRLERQHPGDLPNRVIGARLQKDGISPYFYGWDSTQPMRYYDPSGYHTIAASNVTASPFFHQLLYPIADLPQRTFSRVWLLIQYLVWAAMLGMVISFTNTSRQKLLILVIGTTFLFTRFWVDTVLKGQNYFLIGLFFLVITLLLTRPGRLLSMLIAGGLMAGVVLIKPTAVFFFPPFLFIWKQWPVKSRLSLLAGSLLVIVSAFASGESRYYWLEYRHALNEHIKLHQRLQPDSGQKALFNRHLNYEGWDMDLSDSAALSYRYKFRGENSNIFVLYEEIFKRRLPVAWMLGLCIVLISALLLFYYRIVVLPDGFTLVQAALLGVCMYIIADLFSPIHRFTYNGAPWLAAFLAIGWYKRLPYIAYILLTIALFLQVTIRYIMPMQYSIGEYLILISFLIIAIQKPSELRA